MTTTLEPIEPYRAVELYLGQRETEVAASTLQTHRSRLRAFLRWCELEEIGNMNDLTGRKLHEFRIWRRNDGDLNRVSEKTQMQTLRVFIRWCESIEAVDADLSTKVQSPSLATSDDSRDVMLSADRATAVLSYHEKYHYASLEHVTLALLWHTMMRRGSARALDVEDYHTDERYLEVVHRPDTGTPLKNKADGERLVALSEQMCTLLDDWVADQRPSVEDEHGRQPLLATLRGRLGASTITTYAYRATRPCIYTDGCPHDRDIESCDGTDVDLASKCPSSVSPHAMRRGSITHSLEEGTPDKVISDRANVSQGILDKHYDRRDERTKMEQRRDYLDRTRM
ncbi:tyrosine-type recombinase/integrase [Halomarina oriensis]|uniref:Tyrosine-type recombinase/integrase n=1 Tax=Halomarina oriensis TaxID=671145 RepID=A0A6B0GPC5_9EURY|nr:tyrosine-type recombinase/integrase [Halomarina oriensis]MWG36672.1 tyrosine-type recombinase/integrase [Halomarina oriensis]